MRITEVTHERVKNLGNFESVRVSLTAELSQGDTAQIVLEKLKIEAMKFLKIPIPPKKKENPA